ncbi:MAG: aminomethyltransferase beta-barrel domain-containing protein [Lachnospiraceae bacterium]
MCGLRRPRGSPKAPPWPRRKLPLHRRFRYRQADQAVTVTRKDDELLIEADELQRAVTPGQSVVLYQGDVCLGGGIAEEAWK